MRNLFVLWHLALSGPRAHAAQEPGSWEPTRARCRAEGADVQGCRWGVGSGIELPARARSGRLGRDTKWRRCCLARRNATRVGPRCRHEMGKGRRKNRAPRAGSGRGDVGPADETGHVAAAP